MNNTNTTERRIHQVPAGCISNRAMLWKQEGIHCLGFEKSELTINGQPHDPYLSALETDIELRKVPVGGYASVTANAKTKSFQKATPFAWKTL